MPPDTADGPYITTVTHPSFNCFDVSLVSFAEEAKSSSVTKSLSFATNYLGRTLPVSLEKASRISGRAKLFSMSAPITR